MRKTKIICTLSNRFDKKGIISLVKNGLNVARLNFSHMEINQSNDMINLLKEIRKELDLPLSIMMDTKGPEVRLYGFKKTIPLVIGSKLTIKSHTKPDITDIITEQENILLTNLPTIDKLTTIGQRVLLMDGFIEAIIISKNTDCIEIEIKNAGSLRPKAHLSIPNLDYPLPFMSEKDKIDISYAVEQNLDYLALSFVRSKEDIFSVRNVILDTNPKSEIRLIAKIENKKAIENLDEIINHADGIMVARGDLGVELDLEDVPVMQKKIIQECYLSGKPVITATQMLESMIENRVPTRAEASDVANACYDMTSAVMLSGETAIGQFPDLVVQTMNRIIQKVENSYEYKEFFDGRRNLFSREDLTTIICYNAVSTAYQSNAKAILVFTKSGYSARMISKLRPGLPIHAFTLEERVYHQLALNWGIIPHLLEEEEMFESLIQSALKTSEEKEFLKKGDLAVIVTGLPLGKRGTTNTIRVETIGKLSIKGKVVNPGTVSAPVFHIHNLEDLKSKDIKGKIILLKNFKKEYTTHLKYVGGIIMEKNTNESELSLLGLAYNIPIMVNLYGAMDKISEGTVIEINSERKIVIEY